MIRFLKAHRSLGIFALILYAGVILCGFMWEQNAFEDLAKRRLELRREVSLLRGDVVRMNAEKKELLSLENIAVEAAVLGLGYGSVPVKVKKVGKNP